MRSMSYNASILSTTTICHDFGLVEVSIWPIDILQEGDIDRWDLKGHDIVFITGLNNDNETCAATMIALQPGKYSNAEYFPTTLAQLH